jgi:hypothetical protein
MKKYWIYIISALAASGLIAYLCWSMKQDAANGKIGISPIKGFISGAGEAASKGASQPAQVQPEGCPVILSASIMPEYPTVTDSIKAVVVTDGKPAAEVEFEYIWFINAKPVESADSDTLPGGLVKKGDAVSCNVTPYAFGKRCLTHQAYQRLVFGALPVLSLKPFNGILGQSVELQLAVLNPDGGKIVYALEDPRIDGMTIDKDSGKITWKSSKAEKGVFKFGASATGMDGARTTRVFEFSIHEEVKVSAQ